MMKFDLNPRQKEAVIATEGYYLILAGAGSGKTRVLTERIAYLIREKNISPERILAFTFTNKAAGEMRVRVEKALSRRKIPFWVSTFHSTGLKILRKEANRIGFRNNFAVYDEDDSIRLIKGIIKKDGWSLDEYPPSIVRNRISGWKNGLVTPEEARNSAVDGIEELMAKAYRLYDMELKRCNSFDFDDLITRVIELFTVHPKIRERYARQFKYLLVDEFQDTNTIQMMMIDMLASQNKNLFVVGDDDQAIYGWRGATIDNILQFDRLYEGTVIIRLEENYRSTNNILSASNAVIAHNLDRKGKKLWSKKGDGEKVRVIYNSDSVEEARAVREAIIRLIRNGCRRDEIAVLYRTHAQSRALETAMLQGGLPYQIIGGVRFYERKEIKDLLGYLKLVNNPDDDLNFKRVINVPKRGIGNVTLERIEKEAGDMNLLPAVMSSRILDRIPSSQSKRIVEFAKLIASLKLKARNESAYDVLTYLIDTIKYRSYLKEDIKTAQVRLDNIDELLNETKRFTASSEDPSLAGFLEEIALISNADSLRDEDKVSLMTLHNSKGLEYRIVMIAGVEEGLLPHFSSFDDEREMEEERRLFYVGMTRAMDELYIFCAASRMQFGNWTDNRPSRFLEEIPQPLKEISGFCMPSAAGDDLFKGFDSDDAFGDSRDRSSTDSKFRVGVSVQHSSFGEGTIKKVEGAGLDMKVTVYFTGFGQKKFLAHYAPFVFK